MTYEAVGDYLSKTNRSPGQKVSSSTFLLQQIAKEEKTKEQKSSPEEISVERVEQIPKKLFGEEVNKEIDYVKDLLKMQVEEEDVAGSIENALPDILKQLEKSIERDEEKEWEQEYLQAKARMQKEAETKQQNHHRKKALVLRQTAKVLQQPKKRRKKTKKIM